MDLPILFLNGERAELSERAQLRAVLRSLVGSHHSEERARGAGSRRDRALCSRRDRAQSPRPSFLILSSKRTGFYNGFEF